MQARFSALIIALAEISSACINSPPILPSTMIVLGAHSMRPTAKPTDLCTVYIYTWLYLRAFAAESIRKLEGLRHWRCSQAIQREA